MAGVLPATLRVALRSKIAPGDFVMAGVLPATLRVALRSKIAPGDFVTRRILASRPAGRSAVQNRSMLGILPR